LRNDSNPRPFFCTEIDGLFVLNDPASFGQMFIDLIAGNLWPDGITGNLSA